MEVLSDTSTEIEFFQSSDSLDNMLESMDEQINDFYQIVKCQKEEIDELKKLRELILIEEFRQCVHSDIRSHLDDRKLET